ncbi:hypothetical protein LSM04_000050 [Trypanosoma melophagium]|uniref:uncharacterized protein n=1 Tax=Trypanosoma melophagium TaxID=715481 RepID=UPI00351A6F2F|nr:hypothetical protein LSM04_000050 [Trypanosoma melophagium]
MDRSPYRYSGNNTVVSLIPQQRHSSSRTNLDYMDRNVGGRSPLRSRSWDRNSHGSVGWRENTRNLGGKNDVDIRVERVDDTIALSVGDVVGYELVSSDGKWMWSIGTILSIGSNNVGSVDRKGRCASSSVSGGMDLNLISLLGWTLKADDAAERRSLRPFGSNLVASEHRSLRALRRRRDEIAREKSGLARVLHAENVERRLRVADAARESLLRFDSRRWTELLALERPTAGLRAAVRAVFALLRIELLAETEEEEWARQRRFMSTDAFRRLLADAAAARVAGPTVPIVQFTDNLQIETNAELPEVAELMLRWVDTEVRLGEARVALEKVDARLKELERAEEEVGLELRWRERTARNKRGNGNLHYNNGDDYDDIESYNDDDDDNDDDDYKNSEDEEQDEKYVRSVIKSFSRNGRVLFVRGKDTIFVVQSSVFCRIVGRAVEPMLNSLVIHRDCLARIRAAALEKHKRVTRNRSSVNRGSGKFSQDQNNKLLDAACQVEVMYEQSFKRERIMVRELESLYEKHIQYTDTQLRLLRRSLASKTPVTTTTTTTTAVAGSTNMQNTVTLMELTVPHNRVKELEETLREKEHQLRVMQATHDNAIKKLQEQLLRETGKERVYEQSRLSVLMFQRFRLEHGEEVTRLRISSDEASQWSLLLMHELGGSKDLAIADMSQKYLQEVGILRKELVDRKRRQLKTVSILENTLMQNHMERKLQEQPYYNQEIEVEDQQSAVFTTMLAVERALQILRDTDSLDTSMETLTSLQSEGHVQYKRDGKRYLPTQSRGLEKTKPVDRFSRIQEEEIEGNDVAGDVVILKDRLIEAMQERELIQEILAREQERNRLLTQEGDALRSELLQEVERHAILEEMVKNLQEEIATMMGFLRSSSPEEVKELHGGNAVDRRDWQNAQRDTIAKLRGIITMYDKQLTELLAEEGLSNNVDFIDYYDSETNVGEVLDNSFTSLRNYLFRLKETCAAMQAERDAQAADANMLESYLKTAADALENALVHDERWKPRTTKSKHTTWHCKTFPGDDWGRVITETPEALSKALVHDIMAACHLPEEYVLNLRYSDEGSMLRVSFDLRHDPSITTEELLRRLNECNFYELEKIYARRFAPEEGIDVLKRQLREKDEEMRRLREIISRLRNGSNVSWSTSSILSS